jgi:hypothetical protein
MSIHYLKAIDLVCALNFDPDDNWTYRAEIDATRFARVAVYDENGIKLGYLGEFDIIKSEAIA